MPAGSADASCFSRAAKSPPFFSGESALTTKPMYSSHSMAIGVKSVQLFGLLPVIWLVSIEVAEISR